MIFVTNGVDLVILRKRKFSSNCPIVLFFLFSLFVSYIIFVSRVNADSCINSNEIYDRFNHISVEPWIQLPGRPCLFSCIAYPMEDINSVELVITYPSRSVIMVKMNLNIYGKYYYNLNFLEPGRYYFFINLHTSEEGLIQSSLYSYWITFNLDDKDNDQLSDTWEEQFGFNSEYPYDAYFDSDNDGYSNLDEYQMKTNPLENNIIENAWFKLKQKQLYLFLSFILYCILFVFSLYGIRREST